MICPNELPDAPEWTAETKPWDDAGCCPAGCERVCEIGPNIELGCE